jgi:transposase
MGGTVKKRVLVGMDVSASSLDVAIDRGHGPVWTGTFENAPAGHRKLLGVLTKRGARVRVGLESTGVYHLEVALTLHGRRGIEVMVANPRATKDFARARMQRSKTDRTDARSLLEFVRRMPFEPWQPPAPEILALRAVSRHLEALAGMRAQERNREHASEQVAELTGPVREAIAEHLAFLEQSIQDLQQKALSLIAASDRLQRAFDHLVSVKGIAALSAIALLAELEVLPEDMTTRQWVAHAGLDPRQEESGTSVSARVRISKVGNRHIRRALFMPAIVAVRHEPHVQAFYEKLLARGKKPMQANVAVMRKLLHAIHGMLRNDQDFDGEKFFAINA